MSDLTCSKQFKRDTVALILTKLDGADTPGDFLAQIDELSTDHDQLLTRDSIDLEEPLSTKRLDSGNAEILFEAVGQIDRVNETGRKGRSNAGSCRPHPDADVSSDMASPAFGGLRN